MDLQDRAIYKKLLNSEKVSKEDLIGFLAKAADSYYTSESFITDDEFDLFKKVFKNTYNEELPIGTKETLKGFAKADHGIPMGSLTEFDTTVDVVKDITKWVNKNAEGEDLCVSEKLDGLSVSIRYDLGKLNQGLTRGEIGRAHV